MTLVGTLAVELCDGLKHRLTLLLPILDRLHELGARLLPDGQGRVVLRPSQIALLGKPDQRGAPKGLGK